MQRIATTLIVFSLAILAGIPGAQGTVYYSKEEAFELAFGEGATIEEVPLFLTDEQTAAVEKLAQVKLDSQMFTFYQGRKQGQTLGYAAIESHNVRTQPETMLVVLSPKGELVRTEILAFHEPPEYQPAAGWFERLKGRSIPDLRLNQGIDGISGATLSCRASLDSVRKTLAVYRTALSGGNP
jgi:Na+-translocating ferredoxin:NAD+ oxidoreductase RnfG subunit